MSDVIVIYFSLQLFFNSILYILTRLKCCPFIFTVHPHVPHNTTLASHQLGLIIPSTSKYVLTNTVPSTHTTLMMYNVLARLSASPAAHSFLTTPHYHLINSASSSFTSQNTTPHIDSFSSQQLVRTAGTSGLEQLRTIRCGSGCPENLSTLHSGTPMSPQEMATV